MVHDYQEGDDHKDDKDGESTSGAYDEKEGDDVEYVDL